MGATTATTERGLLRPSPLLRLLLPLRLRLIPGTDTTAMATGLMATTGLMAMDTTTERGLLMLLLRLLLIPGTDTMAMASTMATMATTGLMATTDTMERGLLRLSLLLRLLLPLRLRLIPGTDTTAMATGLMAMDTTDIGLMAMDTTTERGLLMLSLLLMLLLPPRPRLIPGTDTMAMATGLMAMDTTDIGLMAMPTGERSKECYFKKTAAN